MLFLFVRIHSVMAYKEEEDDDEEEYTEGENESGDDWRLKITEDMWDVAMCFFWEGDGVW